MMTFLRCLGWKTPAGVGEKILRGFSVIVYRPLADGALLVPESRLTLPAYAGLPWCHGTISPAFFHLFVGFLEFVLSLLPRIAYAGDRNR